MSPDFSKADNLLTDAAYQSDIAITACVYAHGEPVYGSAHGCLDPQDHQRRVSPETLFDLASVTKLFTTTAFMRLVELGQVGLDDRVGDILSDFQGMRALQPYEDPLKPGSFVDVHQGHAGRVDAGTITFRQLLSHSSGLPAWRPLFKEPDAASARAVALHTFFSYLPGTQVIYSDIGLILVGLALEKLSGLSLEQAIRTWVTQPLGLVHTRFRPFDQSEIREQGNIAPTEQCPWRKRRMLGEVDDENAYQLGGISGHAGLFSTAEELARFGESLRRAQSGLPGLLQQDTLLEMTRIQAESGLLKRGLGFVLWSADPEGSGFPFSPDAFGHTGFTGTSLWVDPARKLSVALLTNEVFNGRQNRKIANLRLVFHRAIVESVSIQ